MLILISALPSSNIYSQNRDKGNISLNLFQMNLKEILKEVEKQTSYSFVYTGEINLSETRTINISEVPLPSALHQIFAGTKIDWRFFGNHILLKEKIPALPSTTTTTILISGFVSQDSTNIPLERVFVRDLLTNKTTYTDKEGYYSLEVEKGNIDLQFSHISYYSKRIKTSLYENTTINISLKEEAQLLNVVTIIEIEPSADDGVIDLSGVSVGRRQLALYNEIDPLASLHYMPGFQSGVEGRAGINVQGGNLDQNRMLMDGVETYNTGRPVDIFPLFNGNIVKKMSLNKDKNSTSYGNNLSATMDMQVKEGNQRKHNGKIKIGTSESGFTLNGPIAKHKTTYLFAARKSHMESYRIIANSENRNIPRFTYYDINAKITHQLADEHTLSLTFFDNGDKLDVEKKKSLTINKQQEIRNIKHWRNTLLMLKWNYKVSPKISGNSFISYSGHKSVQDFSDHMSDSESGNAHNQHIHSKSQITDTQFGTDFNWNPNFFNTVTFGGNIIYHHFEPIYKKSNSFSVEQRAKNIETSIYVHDKIEILDALKTNIGVRGSALDNSDKTYYDVQPQASMEFVPLDGVKIRGAYTRSNQYKFLLSSNSLNDPTTSIWLPANKHFEPLSSDQYTLDVNYDIETNYNFILTGFYSRQRNLPYAYNPTIYFADYSSSDIESGKGQNYGSSVFMQKNSGKFTGWIGYTLSWSKLQYENINNGNPFYANYDRRHSIGVNLNYNITTKIDVSAAWSYVSGSNLYDLSNNGSSKIASYTHTQTHEYPASHHLDINCNYTVSDKVSWVFSVYNIYNRHNPYFTYSSMNKETYKFDLYGVIPSLSFVYRIK